MRENIVHPLEPFYDSASRILILGTMPSPKSRETGFYYGHPQNRFWRVLAEVFGEQVPRSNEEKKSFLKKRHIALWDVLKSCDINGAQDSSIRNPEVNDLRKILSCTRISQIYTTGRRSTALYKKYCAAETGMSTVYLPSTSPAHCAGGTFQELVKAYQVILNDLRMDGDQNDQTQGHRDQG